MIVKNFNMFMCRMWLLFSLILFFIYYGTYRNVEHPDEVFVRQSRQPDGRCLRDGRVGDLLDHHRHVSRHIVAYMSSIEYLHKVTDL